MNTNQSRIGTQGQFALKCLFAEKNVKYGLKHIAVFTLRPFPPENDSAKPVNSPLFYQLTV
ncbi:MAG: hypothetical protein SOI28_19045 [Rahnella inusitata]|uniref:hypothetical protein n=1 Tax=Rahnella inusitata TaxID=58169 RepID=UPI0010A9579D|nr:hypothetical protein [Rahnella inusitata]NMC22718.1 hypothetical protein [Serratia sp. (in: enterobacteria)]